MLEQPYALTLWTYYQIAERDRIRGLTDRLRDVNNAHLMTLAFNTPEKIQAEITAAKDAAKEEPDRAKSEAERVEWKRRAEALVARIENERVLADA